MTQICNRFLSFNNPATEELKNRQIELGSAALFKSASACMLALSAVEDGSRTEIHTQLELAIQRLVEARKHYDLVATLVQEAEMAQQYLDWLRDYDFASLLRDRKADRSLPAGADSIWNLVGSYNVQMADPKGSFLNEFVPRLNELLMLLEALRSLVEDDFTLEVSPSLVPKEFWKLQSVLHEVMLVGQSIAIMNALTPEIEYVDA